jgi:lincosamide nucleotidyltransferase A/C/D/E
MMEVEELVRIMEALAESRIPAWLDGGWGVDALVGRQTRPHEDLDLVVALEAVDAVLKALQPFGYAMGLDERPTRLVLEAWSERRIDLHTVVFDSEGGGVQHLQDGRSYRYPPQGFAGVGVVDGRRLPCLTPEVQIECHMGYEPTDTDKRDVGLLAERFGLPLPKAYR